MTKKEYATVLRAAISSEISAAFENPRYEQSDFLQGFVSGLYTAIEKIDSSEFLTEDDE